MKSKVPLGFILLDNQIIIDYVKNRTYILQASKRRQIQLNCLLNLRYEFKYPMSVNITRYDDILLFTFNAQAVNHLSPITGFRFNYLKMMIQSFQSCTNPLCRSSLKGWVQRSAFLADGYLVPNPLMRYVNNPTHIDPHPFPHHLI